MSDEMCGDAPVWRHEAFSEERMIHAADLYGDEHKQSKRERWSSRNHNHNINNHTSPRALKAKPPKLLSTTVIYTKSRFKNYAWGSLGCSSV